MPPPLRAILLAAPLALAQAALAQPYTVSWWTVDGGGTAALSDGVYAVGCTSGQPDAGTTLSGGTYTLAGGFWPGVGAPPCYSNCDGSTTPPALNVNDFACFLNRFAAGDSYANCDGSTTPPILNVIDFACFLNSFAAGCP